MDDRAPRTLKLLATVLALTALLLVQGRPFEATMLVAGLSREVLPDFVTELVCLAPLHHAGVDPVPGLLAVATDGRSSSAELVWAGQRARRVSSGRWGVVYELPAGADPRVWARGIPHAEPVWERTISGSPPNDPGFGVQWHLWTLDLPSVRARSTGGGVVIAVVDTGVTAGDDGPLNLLPGVDLVYGEGTAEDLHGHGSMVAVIIAQATDNGQGYASLAPDVTILPIRACNEKGSCTSANIAAGIDAAVARGAAIVNISVSGRIRSEVEARAIRSATAAGVLVVAAAGNESGAVGWPAAMPEVVAVGALDHVGQAAAYSNRGAGIDLWAPGGDCERPLTQEIAHGEDQRWGTSFAAPLVSATIALGVARGASPRAALQRLTAFGPPGFQVLSPRRLWGDRDPPSRHRELRRSFRSSEGEADEDVFPRGPERY